MQACSGGGGRDEAEARRLIALLYLPEMSPRSLLDCSAVFFRRTYCGVQPINLSVPIWQARVISHIWIWVCSHTVV